MTPDLTQRASDPVTILTNAILDAHRGDGESAGIACSNAVRRARIGRDRVSESALACELAIELRAIRARWQQFAEADAPDTEGYRPNEAMQIVTAIDAALERAGVEVPK